jgi:DmsE family decaheme c-type cytochrome
MRAALLLACLLWGAGVAPTTAHAADEPRDLSAACVRCHGALGQPDLAQGAHTVHRDARGSGCVSCHGASVAHANKAPAGARRAPPDRVFGAKGSSPPAEQSGACLACHRGNGRHVLWPGSAHEAANVACTDCHRLHTAADAALTRHTEPEACRGCHREPMAKFQKLFRHPVPEGAMGCSDCHAVHGSAGPKLVRRDSTNATCHSCHADKRGPFVQPHEPVMDDCATCHDPHGSSVAGMLRVRMPLLCQQCHTPHVAGGVGALGGQRGVYTPAVPGGTPLVNGTSNGKNVVTMWQGRSCMNCHVQVHGSNNPAAGPLLLR